MKIYFGRIPKEMQNDIVTDAWVYEQLQTYTCEELGKVIEDGIYNKLTLNTFNILLINYLTDDYAKENIYFVNADTNNVEKFADNYYICEKLSCMGPGEALSDTRFITL
jgi:hypothetical protein